MSLHQIIEILKTSINITEFFNQCTTILRSNNQNDPSVTFIIKFMIIIFSFINIYEHYDGHDHSQNKIENLIHNYHL